jgi:hypothetical protein
MYIKRKSEPTFCCWYVQSASVIRKHIGHLDGCTVNGHIIRDVVQLPLVGFGYEEEKNSSP